MPFTPYSTAEHHGKVDTDLHIEDIDVSDDRSTLRIHLRQRNLPEIKVTWYLGLNCASKPQFASSLELGDLVPDWVAKAFPA